MSYKKKKVLKVKTTNIRNFMYTMTGIVMLHNWSDSSNKNIIRELISDVNTNIGVFLSQLNQKEDVKIKRINKQLSMISISEQVDVKSKLNVFQEYLINIDKILSKKKDSDLLGIRDKLLLDVNKIIYFLIFDG